MRIIFPDNHLTFRRKQYILKYMGNILKYFCKGCFGVFIQVPCGKGGSGGQRVLCVYGAAKGSSQVVYYRFGKRQSGVSGAKALK